MLDYAYKPFEENLTRLAENRVLDGKVIIVFGSRETAKEAVCILTRFNLKVSYGLNNNLKIKLMHGVRVYSPEKMRSPFIGNAAILIASGYYEEMKAQLEEMGYLENVHIYNLNKRAKEMQINEEMHFTNFNEKLKDGLELYKRFVERHGEQKTMFLRCDEEHLGHAHSICERIKKEGINDCVIASTKKSTFQMAELYDIPYQAVTLSELTGLCYISKWFHMDGKPLRVKIIGTMTYEHALHPAANIYDRSDKIHYERPLIEDKTLELEKLFKDNGFKKGRTVLLAPMAQSCQLLPVSVWEGIARRLTENGYTVCLNVVGRREIKAIADAVPITLPVSLVIQFLEYAGYFIGLRSGLCDFANMADCKRVILYPEVRYNDDISYPIFLSTLKKSIYDFGNGRYSTDRLYEIACDKSEEEIINEVMQAMEEST